MSVCLRYLCLVAAMTAYFVLSAQYDEDRQAIMPSSVTLYDVNNGLPISCVFGGIFDQNNQLWLNPCFGQEEYLTTSFYRFDGDESFALDWNDRPDDRFQQAVISGFFPDGRIYGFFRHSPYVFICDRETGIKDFYKINKEGAIIYTVDRRKDNSLIIYGIGPGTHLLYTLPTGEDALSLLTETPRQGYIEMRGNDWWYPQSQVLTERDYWFLNQDTTAGATILIRYNFADASVTRYTLDDIDPDLPDRSYRLIDKRWMIGDSDDNVHLTVGNSIYQYIFRHTANGIAFERDSSVWDAQHTAATYANGPAYADAQGNQLFVHLDPQKDLEAVLVDARGRVFDYSKVIRAARDASRIPRGNIRSVFSTDLLRHIYLFMDGGLASVEIQVPEGITVLAPQFATRGLLEYEEDVYLIMLPAIGEMPLTMIRTDGEDAPLQMPPMITDISRVKDHASLVRDKYGDIWFPRDFRTLVRTRDGRIVKKYPFPPGVDRFIACGDSLVLCGRDNLLYVFSMEKESVHPYLLGKDSIHLAGVSNEILKTSSGLLFVAGLKGLNVVNPHTQTKQILTSEDGFQDDQIMALHEDTLGRVWVGTYSAGLHVYDPEKGHILGTNQDQGLSNNTVIGILEDDSGLLWVATYDGLNLVNYDGRVLTRWYKEDGLSSNEFNRYSSLKDDHGRLFFGSVSGMNMIEPEIFKKRRNANPDIHIYLCGMTYYDTDYGVDTTRHIGFDFSRPIRLAAAHRYIHLKFNLTSFSRPENFLYQYRIEGGHATGNKWSSLGSQPELSLFGMLPGNYDIRIRGFDHRGNPSREDIVIPIHAAEFIYRQPVFYFFIAMLVSGFAFAWLWREVAKRRSLEAVVAERTRKIREDKEVIEQQAHKLRELDQIKSRFFTNLSHEFRTPLTVIGGMADKITEKPEKWSVQGMQAIRRNTSMLLDLVNQILELRKLESGKMQPRLIPRDVVGHLHTLAESFLSLAEHKDISMSCGLTPDELYVLYDPEMWQRIFSNLLSNAIKYTPPGGSIVVSSHFTPSKNQDLKGVFTISVRDTGRGISEEALKHIFDLFYQAESPEPQPVQGTGVGLALTKELVQLLGGEIRVESRHGEGSLFTVALPVQLSEDRAPDIEGSPIVSGGFPSMPLPGHQDVYENVSPDQDTILVVEDNADVAHYIGACLDDTYRLLFAKDGLTGEQMALTEMPDLIVSDVMMPGKDGFDLCESLKSDMRTSHIPIVLLTARADDLSRFTGYTRGADAYLTKPFNETELHIRISNLLEIRRKLRDKYSGSDHPIPVHENFDTSLEDQFIQQLTEIILNHEDDMGLDVTQLCRKVGMSRTHLHKKIKSLTGKSTTHFVRFVKLREAQKLMRERPDLNLTQIAEQSGFSSIKYFSRIFSETYGVSPSQYRENQG